MHLNLISTCSSSSNNPSLFFFYFRDVSIFNQSFHRHPSFHLFIHPSIHPPKHPTIHQFTHPSIHQPVHPSIHPSFNPSIVVFPTNLRVTAERQICFLFVRSCCCCCLTCRCQQQPQQQQQLLLLLLKQQLFLGKMEATNKTLAWKFHFFFNERSSCW